MAAGAGEAIVMGPLDKNCMRRVGLLLAIALLAAGCSQQEPESTGSIDDCARNLFPSYNPKIYDQCVAVCKKCERGITTTCTTSCTLKGAR
jgi:type IV pilus biogenesis protein CpaD/CtpE